MRPREMDSTREENIARAAAIDAVLNLERVTVARVEALIDAAVLAERERCANEIRALRDVEDEDGGERRNAFAEAENVIRARGEVRPPTVVGVTRDGRPVTR